MIKNRFVYNASLTIQYVSALQVATSDACIGNHILQHIAIFELGTPMLQIANSKLRHIQKQAGSRSRFIDMTRFYDLN